MKIKRFGLLGLIVAAALAQSGPQFPLSWSKDTTAVSSTGKVVVLLPNATTATAIPFTGATITGTPPVFTITAQTAHTSVLTVQTNISTAGSTWGTPANSCILLDVIWNRAFMLPTTDYTVSASGSQITFTTMAGIPQPGDVLIMRCWQ